MWKGNIRRFIRPNDISCLLFCCLVVLSPVGCLNMEPVIEDVWTRIVITISFFCVSCFYIFRLEWNMVRKEEEEAKLQEQSRAAQKEKLQRDIEKQYMEHVEKIIQPHIKVLSRKRDQMVLRDDYGLENTANWKKEKDYFINRVVCPGGKLKLEFTLSSKEEATLQEKALLEELSSAWSLDVNGIVRDLIEAMIWEYNSHNLLEPVQSFDSTMSPYDYEKYCTDQLNKCGWEAKTTKASGDQGLDIYAEKGDLTIVVQCKKYSYPVGNKAVQEVHAARGFANADYAVVVTNSTYTNSARQLAKSLGVILLHHEDLNDLDARISGI